MAHKERKEDLQDAATKRAERALAGKSARGVLPAEEFRELLDGYRKLLGKFRKVMVISDTYSAELKGATEQLRQVQSLVLPICMYCKKIRVDDEYWEQVEGYFARHIDVAFTHGICPNCMEERFRDLLPLPEARERIALEVRAHVRPS
jgi:hypothetical protein